METFPKRPGLGRRSVLSGIAAAAALAAAGPGLAEAYPSRPVKFLIPFSAGGPTDLIGRIVAKEISRPLGQQVVVENKPGAAGLIASQAVAQANPDGYTLLFHEVTGAFAIQPEIAKSLPYDVKRDFTPIGFAARGPIYLLVNSALPVRSVRDLVALSKTKRLAFGSAGGAGQLPTHIGPELLKIKAGFEATHVPYKGTGPALVDLAAGRVHFMMTTGTGSARPFLDSGQIRVVAVTGTSRSEAMPNVPTFAEAGASLPELDTGTTWALFGPRGLPAAVVQKLHAALGECLKSPELVRVYGTLEVVPVAGSPRELQAMIEQDSRAWGPLVSQMNIQTQ